MRNPLFNGLTEVCTKVGNMANIPPVPCMGTPTHYGIYTVYGTSFCVLGSDMADPRTQNSVPYTVYIPTTILYIIHTHRK